MQVFLQILNPVNNGEILAPELVCDQSEMVVKYIFTLLSYECAKSLEAFISSLVKV